MSTPLPASTSPAETLPPATTRGGDLLFWLFALALTAYVALCTPHRDVHPEADAWEHHRVVRVLAGELWRPGNPTFALDAPSIRYSPYFLVQAAFCRSASIDPYTMLSAAAVLNTALLCLGVWSVCLAWGERRAAPLVLLTIVGLWGVAPGYAGTLALADLPWHQVNPSAFSFATFLLALGALKRFADRGGAWRWAGIVLICVCAMLDHAMTGAFALLALLIAALLEPARRFASVSMVFLAGAVALGVCLAWPWYPFVEALTSRQDVDYWFNPTISKRMFLLWCLPAILLSLAAMLGVDRPLVRTALSIGVVAGLFALFAIPLRSATFARFAMPGTIFLQIAIAVWAYRSGLLDLSHWRAGLRRLNDHPSSPANATTILLILLVIGLAYGLVPQMLSIVREPHLARPLAAQFLDVDKAEPHLKPIYDQLLSEIGERDVVMATPLTGWPVPSSRGRVVAALHYERFVSDQPQRDEDCLVFFRPGTSPDVRSEILQRRGVRWILIDTLRDDPDTQAALLRDHPKAGQVAHLLLLRAAGE